jgi:hypothetical protein
MKYFLIHFLSEIHVFDRMHIIFKCEKILSAYNI